MPKPHDPELARRLEDRTAINAALRRGVGDALERHRQAGVPAVTWENGQIVLLAPDRICTVTDEMSVKNDDQTGPATVTTVR